MIWCNSCGVRHAASPPPADDSVAKKHCPICRHLSSSVITPNCFHEFQTFFRQAFSSSSLVCQRYCIPPSTNRQRRPKLYHCRRPLYFWGENLGLNIQVAVYNKTRTAKTVEDNGCRLWRVESELMATFFGKFPSHLLLIYFFGQVNL